MNYTSFILLLLISFSYCVRQPRKYVIDLDAPASERWNEVVHDHLDAIPEFVKVAQSYVPKQLLPIAFWIAGELNRFFPEEYADEIRGIAKASGLPLGLVVSMNILYDILAFDRKHVFQLGCTSIVAQSEDGVIYHGRNLDYDMGDLLKNITILVDFTRGQGDERLASLYASALAAARPHRAVGSPPCADLSANRCDS
ncbi:hypothetical protein Y032_0062g3396 [Ancylostoma ceylanicum]|uniref:Acid ceramidase N-terminal domain-containing protein n=1 Tax=Ancylostoma ceylanicum TaxID=53326 RepID=A0A016U2H2_9BILA|nr:hypothetical protein Y032_0062g3396 [Ancylostoma ceylanicum]